MHGFGEQDLVNFLLVNSFETALLSVPVITQFHTKWFLGAVTYLLGI